MYQPHRTAASTAIEHTDKRILFGTMLFWVMPQIAIEQVLHLIPEFLLNDCLMLTRVSGLFMRMNVPEYQNQYAAQKLAIQCDG